MLDVSRMSGDIDWYVAGESDGVVFTLVVVAAAARAEAAENSPGADGVEDWF